MITKQNISDFYKNLTNDEQSRLYISSHRIEFLSKLRKSIRYNDRVINDYELSCFCIVFNYKLL